MRANAQVGLVEIGAGTIAVKKLLDDFEGAANRLLQNGATQADSLAASFGNQVGVATRNLKLALQDQQDTLFKNLDPQAQQAITALNDMLTVANQSVERAASIAEVANLNLIEFTNRLPFTEKIRFYVNSVKGLSQIYSNADYQMQARGLGFGFAPNDQKYLVTLKIGDKVLPASAVRPLTATDTQFLVPHEMLVVRI
jgi:hypothetical protein